MTFLDEIKMEGRAEGRTGMLLEQLEVRFGSVPTTVRAQVQAADEATLSRWAVRVLTATSVAEVVGRGSEASPARKPAARVRARRG